MDDAMKRMEQLGIAGMPTEMAHLQPDLRIQNSKLRTEMRTEIAHLRVEMAHLRADWQEGLAAIREERQASWRRQEWLMLTLMAAVYLNLGIRIAAVL